MEAVYYVKEHEYKVTSALVEDIDTHYSTVDDNVADVDKDVYINAMEEAIRQGRAWKVTKDGNEVGFLYIRKVINTWLGCSIYSVDMIGIMLLFKTLHEQEGAIHIKYAPHQGMLKSVKSLATRKSIRLYHNGGTHLRIDTGALAVKFTKMYDVLGVSKWQ